MFKQLISCLLVVTLIGSLSPLLCADQPLEQMKSTVSKMETENRVTVVKMKDGTSLTGRVRAGDESFTVVTKDSLRTVSYADVAQVKKKGLHLAAKVAIGLGIMVAILFGGIAASGSGGCPGGCHR